MPRAIEQSACRLLFIRHSRHPRGIGDPARYWEGCCADGGLLVVTLRDHGGGLTVWRRHPHAGRDDLDIEVRITVSRPD